MNILKHLTLLAIFLKCVIASESSVKADVIEVIEEEGFESIKRDWRKWSDRKDLFDHVVTKSVEFIAGFINQVKYAKERTLAALFLNSPDKVDEVLDKIDRPERVKISRKTFNGIKDLELLGQVKAPGDIIASYVLGEGEKEIEDMD